MAEMIYDKRRLWEGAILGGLTASVTSAKLMTLGRARFWEDTFYVCDGLDGREGIVLFEDSWRSSLGMVVGLFFDPKSVYNPHNCSDYDVNSIIGVMPPRQREIADDIIHSSMTAAIDGIDTSLVTAAVWSSEGDQLATSEMALQNGLNLISKEFKGFSSEACEEWKSDFGATTELMNIVIKLFRQRTASPDAIQLDQDDSRLLFSHVDDSSQGDFRHYLSLMNIYVTK